MYVSVKKRPGWWCAFGLLPVAAFLLGFFLPFERYQWLALGVYVPLALVLRRAGPLPGFLAGMLFGVVGWAAGTWWLLHSMCTMMHFPFWKGLGAAMLIWLYQGLPFGAFGLICGWMNKRGRPAGPVFCAGLFTLLLFLRPRLCPVSGAVSVALWPAFIQIADLGGEYLVLFCLLLLNWLLADALDSLIRGMGVRAAFRAATAAALLAVIMGYGHWRLSQYHDAVQQSPPFRTLLVASLQPNVPVRRGSGGAPHADHASDEEMCLRHLAANLDRIRGADLVVFPELPKLDYQGEEFGQSGLEAALQRLDTPVLLPSNEFLYADEQEQVYPGDKEHRGVTRRRISAKYSSVRTLTA